MFWESHSSAFWFQPVRDPCACAQPEVTILHLGGGLSSHRRTQRCVSDCHALLLRRNQDPAPLLHYCFLMPFLCFCIPSHLMSNCLNLPFGTQGRSRRLKPFSYKQETRDTEKSFCTWGGQVLLSFNPPFSLIHLNLEGNRCWTRKGVAF